MKTLQGLALIIQCFVGEVPSFFLSGKYIINTSLIKLVKLIPCFTGYILKHVKHMTIFSMVFFTFFVTYLAYYFIRNPLWALPIEVLNGLAFGLPYSAAISYAAILAPVGAEGTLQGVVGMAIYGIGIQISKKITIQKKKLYIWLF